MATKITYVLLKTLEITKNIPFYAISAFEIVRFEEESKSLELAKVFA